MGNVKSLGFTMIELLMVIMIIATLGAVAVPQFLDFRNEAKAVTVRHTLSTLRVALRNQTQQAILRCGVVDPPTWTTAGGIPYFLAQFVNLYGFNSIAATGFDNSNANWNIDSQNPLWKICDVSQIPNPADRFYVSGLADNQRAHYFVGGVDQGPDGYLPINPFAVTSDPDDFVYSVSWPTSTQMQDYGGPCGLVNMNYWNWRRIIHWNYIADTGEIYAGTNTPGINECNF